MRAAHSRGKLLFTAGLVLLGLTAWLMLGQPRTEGTPIAHVATSATSPEPANAAAASKIALPIAKTPTPERQEAPGASAPEQAAATPLMAGNLIIEEPDGTETKDASGELELILMKGDTGARFRIPVQAGLWQIWTDDLAGCLDGVEPSPPALAAYRVQPRAFEGAKNEDAATPRLYVAEFRFSDPAPTIVLTRVRGVELTVVDAETGTPLDGVRVTPSRYDSYPNSTHPSQMDPSRDLVHSAASPVRVLPPFSLASAPHVGFEVGAVGYAWQSVDLDFKSAAPKTVRLVRGAQLTVRLEPPLEDPNAVLRLAPKDKRLPWITTPATGREELVLNGLNPGQYDLAAQLGNSTRSAVVLAEETIELHAGEQLLVTLATRPAPKLVTAVLKGQLYLPAAWKDNEPELRLQLLGASLDGTNGFYWPELIRLDDEHFAFDFGKVQTGHYALIYVKMDYALDLDLGPEGLIDVRFDIPPPVELRVHVTDASTGATAPITQLFWSVQPDTGARGRTSESISIDADSQRFLLRTPACPIDLLPFGSGFTGGAAVVDATEGLEVELEVHPEACALLTLVSQGEPIDWQNPDFGAVVATEGGKGRIAGLSSQKGSFWFSVSEPGTYEVQVPDLPGFEPHDPVEVDLVEGETIELDIELVPR